MKKLFTLFIMLFLIHSAVGCSKNELQAKGVFPSTIEEIERLSRQELAKLPDVKVPIGRAVDERSLQGINKIMLRIMRNSIFAQYGYSFTIKWLRDYFETRSWYASGGFDATKIAAVDTANIRLIRNYEDRVNPVSPFERIERVVADELKKLPDMRAELNQPVDEAKLKLMNRRELKILKNSIFAQYGREFKTPWLQKYFDSRSWYKRGQFRDSMLTRTDRGNVDLIMRYETSGTTVPEQEILKLGYCETDTGMEIERYVFKAGGVLAYSVESQSPYGRSSDEGALTGRWRLSAGGIEYQLAENNEWEPLQIDTATHICR